jgi:hypothetical protein
MGLDVRRRATADLAIIAQSTQDHTRIVAAIAKGDPGAAGEMMKTHLQHIEESTRRFAKLTASEPRLISAAPVNSDPLARRRRKGQRISSASRRAN